MKNEENEEDVESILDITEVFTDKLDASDGKDEVEENKDEVEVDELLDEKKEVEENETKNQLLGRDGKNDNVAKGTEALTIVTLLQAILVMMLYCVKTLQDQSVKMERNPSLHRL